VWADLWRDLLFREELIAGRATLNVAMPPELAAATSAT